MDQAEPSQAAIRRLFVLGCCHALLADDGLNLCSSGLVGHLTIHQMINFFFAILEHFCPLWYKLPRWVSFCPDGVSFCPEYHTQPLYFTQPSHTLFGNMYIHKTPPTPKHPFSWPELESGQNHLPSGVKGLCPLMASMCATQLLVLPGKVSYRVCKAPHGPIYIVLYGTVQGEEEQ